MDIDNEIYSRDSFSWWDDNPDGAAAFLRYLVNPIRFGYFSRVLKKRDYTGPKALKVLDVGCGGGFLSEEFAKAGFQVSGMDLSEKSVEAARDHAVTSGLTIRYLRGNAERIPFETESFDIVACCDVLEHVPDLHKVIQEIARVLRKDGLFFFDTINRTLFSAMAVIKIAQEWKLTAWEKPRTHSWNRFIKPWELIDAMNRNGLINRELKGISSQINPLIGLIHILRRARGKMSRRELGARLKLGETDDLQMSYMGFAVKG